MERYEEWDVTIPSIPRRSRLYRFQPIGIGTQHVESLTSYIIRLAVAHCVSPKVLITREVLGPLGKLENLEHKSNSYQHHLWSGNAPMLNGTGWWPSGCVRVLETLTQYSGLRFLTMLTWSNVIAQRTMVRSTQAWCSACYTEWRETCQIIYNPLIWSLQAVAICPRHRQTLRVTCPHENCHRSLPVIAIGSRLGHCIYCNRWLGVASESSDYDDAPAGQGKERLCWDAAAVGELIANAPNVAAPPGRGIVALAIRGLSERLTQENLSLLASSLGMSTAAMWNWQSGTQIPQLVQLLRLCFSAGLSLFHFLTLEGVSSHVISITSVNRDPLLIERRRHKRMSPDELHGLLEEVLLEDPVLATWNIRSEKANVRAIEPAFPGCKKTCSRGKI